MYTCPSDRWDWGRVKRKTEEKKNGSEEEAEDTEKGRCVSLIKIEGKIIKQT